MPLKVNQDIDSSINLTPLIDIVFLLIIFFMVGTKFSELNESEKNIALQVPRVANGKALSAAPQKRVINILADGQIMLDDQAVTLQQLEEELTRAKQQFKNLGVVVRGDENAKYQGVAEVLSTCRNSEISNLNISVRTAQHTSGQLK